MKLALACGLMLAAVSAFAQGEMVGVFADPTATNCDLVDASPGLISIYVVHTETPGASAVQFSAPIPSCMTGAVWMSDTPVFPVVIGDSQSGVSVGYGTCSYGPIHVLTINIFAQGLSETCCAYDVYPDPNSTSGRIEVVDCTNALGYALGGRARVNANGSCACGSEAEEATWGKVKSIYDDY